MKFLFAALVLTASILAFADTEQTDLAAENPDKPNILWLTFEDSSQYLLGCYGNQDVNTPNIDGLAAKGVRYTNASSNAPQCSPARSTLISGAYSKTFGTDQHRHQYKIPEDIYFYPKYLRQAGYFCTNNSKQDYNCPPEASAGVWNLQGNKATYNSDERADGQPFFSIFNCGATHMSRLTSHHLEGRRDFRKEGLDPAKLALPPHVPDLPEIRSDYALHLEGIQDVDRWVGIFLEDLKARGLDKDTIIFVFSDHGGCLPRGKGFVNESGLRIPFIIFAPEKWQHLLDGEPGSENERLIGFVDLAPTLLSIAGIPTPEHMQGKAFFGKFATAPRKFQYGFRCNQEDHFDPFRSVTDGRFKYIRYYIPQKPLAVRNFFQWGMPSNQTWDRGFLTESLNKMRLYAFESKPPEALYNIVEDPFETINLANNPQYSDTLTELRNNLSRHIKETKDLGFFPPSRRNRAIDLYTYTRNTSYPLEDLHWIAEQASSQSVEDIEKLIEKLDSSYPEIVYWACLAIAGIPEVAEQTDRTLRKLAEKEDPFVAAAAAFAVANDNLYRAQTLLEQMRNKSVEAYSLLESWSLTEPSSLRLHAEGELINMAETEANTVRQRARSILVNLGSLSYIELYSENTYEKGLRVNQNRKPIRPLP